MKDIKLDYKEYELTKETHLQIRKMDMCNDVIQESRPFEGESLRQIRDFYRINTTWASSALEGNSYTISETKIMLEDGITVGGKPLKHTLEICGHSDAYDHIFSLIHHEGIHISDICKTHKYLMQKEIGDLAGKYKTNENLISGSMYNTISTNQVPKEMDRLEQWMKSNRGKMHPVQFAAEVHRAIVYIHPFSDGNGRTARLIMNALLIQNGYLPCVIAPVMRLDYINTLEAGRNGNKSEFVRFIAEAETETEKDFIRGMHMQMPNFSRVQSELDSYERD